MLNGSRHALRRAHGFVRLSCKTTDSQHTMLSSVPTLSNPGTLCQTANQLHSWKTYSITSSVFNIFTQFIQSLDNRTSNQRHLALLRTKKVPQKIKQRIFIV